MSCWYCHWGWPQQVVEVYRRGLEAAGEMAMHFGPAHIVWGDENFESGPIRWCIEHANEFRGDLSDDEVAAVVRSLHELLAVPEAVRCCEPEGYDGEHPERYPPPDGVVMIDRHPH